MTNVLTKTQAAASAASGKPLARFARNGVLACVLACTAAGALAAGQDRNPRREEMQQQSMRDRYEARAQDQRAYEMQMREERRMQEQRRETEMRDDRGRNGRMTPDERRDLRRQINEAGMDLYPNARRR